MQRERDSNGRFRSPASPAASYERARGPDGRFMAQPALQVANHPSWIARNAESWLNPAVGIFAACNLPTALASNASGAMAAAGTINAPSHSIFVAAANSLPIGESLPSSADIVNGTTSANGTRNAPFLSLFEATDRLPTSGLAPDAARVADPTTTAVSHTIASSLWTSLTGLQCPLVPGLFIERCGAGVPAMTVSKFVNAAMDCLQNLQSGDNCKTCFCALFHANRELQSEVLALHKILQSSSYAEETIGAQMLSAKPLIDFVTDPNPLSEINGLQEAMAHAGGFDLLGVAKQLILEHPHLLKALPYIGGTSLFAVVWFLKWYRPRWWQGDDGRVNVNLEARVVEVQEAEEEEELPTDNTPAIFAENTPITLIHRRIVGRNRQLQYRFHVQNQPHEADNWASIDYLTKVFGSEESLQEAIRKHDSMPLPCDPRSLPWVSPVRDEDARGFHVGRVLV